MIGLGPHTMTIGQWVCVTVFRLGLIAPAATLPPLEGSR